MAFLRFLVEFLIPYASHGFNCALKTGFADNGGLLFAEIGYAAILNSMKRYFRCAGSNEFTNSLAVTTSARCGNRR